MATWTRPLAGLKKVASGGAGQRPLVANLPGQCVQLDQRVAVARDVEEVLFPVDVEAVRAIGRNHPVSDFVEFRQPGGEHHRGIPDREEHARPLAIGDTPPGATGQIDRPPLAPIELQDLELGATGFVANAGNDRQASLRYDRNAVRPPAGVEHAPCLQRAAIDPDQACCSAICDEDVACISDHARRFWKALQRCEVAIPVMINDLETVSGGVRDEDAARFRLERAMVEQRVGRTRYRNNAAGF